MTKRAKILFTAAFILLVFLVAVVLGGRWGIENLRTKAREPENIRLIANKIADFADPLPHGFVWRSGLELPLSKSLTVEHAAPFMIITIDCDEKMKTNIPSLDASLDIGANIGRRMSTAQWTRTGEGSTTVAGKTLKYELGEVRVGEHRVQELRGSLPMKDKTVSFDVFGEWDKKLNTEQLQLFLDSIKTIK